VRWLVLAALADWLIARTLTRLAIFMPKSPAVLLVYQALGVAGQLATTLTALLGLGAVGWIAWREWRAGSVWLPPVWLSLMLFSLFFLVIPPAGWLALANHVLSSVAVGVILARAWQRTQGTQRMEADICPTALACVPPWPAGASQDGQAGAGKRMGERTQRIASRVPEGKRMVALCLPALAFLASRLHQALSTLYTAMHWPGPPLAASALFNLGELLVVLGAFGLWWAYGRGASWRTWLAGGLPALVFGVMHLVAPSMTGIMAVWSIGLTLYLPWPLYAASLWLAGVTVLVALRRGAQGASGWSWERGAESGVSGWGGVAGWAVLLLAAGGYAPQLSSQAFLTLIALWLLSPRNEFRAGTESALETHSFCPRSGGFSQL
jgi:hypothetical protein